MVISVLLFVGVGFLFVILGVPLVRRRVGPNRLYGLRVPATFADRKVWYEANARSGRDLIGLGLMTIVLALALPSFSGERRYPLIMSGFLLAGAIGLGIRGWVVAARLLRERRSNPADSG